MPLSKTWNNQPYSIPETGEFNWQSLTSFLAALADFAQTTTFQKVAVRVAVASPVIVSSANDCIVISNLTTPGPVAVTLPPGASKQIFFIVDGKGDAATNNITITPFGGETINGAADYVINVDYAGIGFIFDGVGWSIFSEFANTSNASSYIQRSKIAAGVPNEVVVNDGSGFLSSEPQLLPAQGGTGVANGGTLTYGSDNLTFTTGGVTTVTLPLTGTLATLDGTETLENKTLLTPLISGGSLDVDGPGGLAIGASVGAHVLSLGDSTTTVTIPGDLTVNGTTTTIDTQTLDVKDANITVNYGGNDTSAEGSGLTIDRTGTDGSFIYRDLSATKFALGPLGAEIDVVDESSPQTLSNKTIDANSNTISNIADANIASGANIDVSKLGTGIINNTEFDYLSGLNGNIQTQIDGKAASGVNSDITELTGLTTPLSIPQGGTGQVTANAALNALLPSQAGALDKYLKSDGTNTYWEDAAGSGTGELNIIENGSAVFNLDGWTSGTSHSFVRDTADSPLNPIIPTDIKMSASAAVVQSATAGVYYPAVMPEGLFNQKLKFEFYFTSPASSLGIWGISIYSGSTRVLLTTDSNGETLLPAGTTGKFTTCFDSDGSTNYTIHFYQQSFTSTNYLYVTDVIVGPGIQPQGAVVEEWQSYTPTTTNFSASSISGKYRRIGDSMQLQVQLTVSGTGSAGDAIVKIPSGFTIDSTKITTVQRGMGSGYWFNSSIFNPLTVEIRDAAAGELRFEQTGTINRIQGSTLALNNEIGLWVTVPIAEWAGSGTVNLAENDVEYASNSSTADANDSTSFVYGPYGSQFASFTAERLRVVRFQTPIQSTDVITIEVTSNGGTTWVPLGTADWIEPWSKQNTTQYGVINSGVITSPTDVSIYFQAYRTAGGATYASAGGSWGSVNSNPLYKWRLKKTSAGNAVGFGIVVPGTSSGLVSASGLPGNTTGNAIAEGYVGENGYLSPASPVPVGASNSYINLLTKTLQPGVWAVQGSVYIGRGTSTGLDLVVGAISLTSQNLDPAPSWLSTAYEATGDFSVLTPVRFLNLSVAQNVYLVARTAYTTAGTAAWSTGSIMTWVRIA